MPIKPCTCHTLECDVCGEAFAPDDYPVHFTSVDQARTHVRGSRTGWVVTNDGLVLCDVQDEPHQARVDELLPPAPVVHHPGQTALDL